MKGLGEQLRSLAPLDAFEQAAFVGEESVPQDVCSFVLALALIYNDYKDRALAVEFLKKAEPDPPPRETQAWGEYTGMFLHAVRITLSLVHELLALIEDNPEAVKHPSFKEVLRLLDARARQSWESLVAASAGIDSGDPLAKALLLVRNNVGFHYSPKELYRGYTAIFGGTGKSPFVSRGRNLRETRFYFADAAAMAYLGSRTPDGDLGRFFTVVSPLLEALNLSLFQIVERFIQSRGHGWRRVTAT